MKVRHCLGVRVSKDLFRNLKSRFVLICLDKNVRSVDKEICVLI